MTVAVDIQTGAVIGQVIGGTWRYDGAYGMLMGSMQLHTANGAVTVDASTVRLEKV